MNPSATLLYIADPMCSWCWGAAPNISQLKEKYRTSLNFEIILGGLRPGTQSPMRPKQKKFLRKHWEEIAELTGQPFSFDILDRDDFIYDTEPPARAVMCIRKLKPSLEFDFFKAIQKAFYEQSRDTNQPEVYYELCEEYFLEVEAFQNLFEKAEIKAETQADFDRSRDLGVMGFPTLLYRVGEKHKALTRGYADVDSMEKQLLHWQEKLST